MTTVAVNRIQVSKRRSSRIALNARIGLSGQDRGKCTFTMPARATNLNRHGAAIQLNRELLVGSAVVVRNGRGTQASARVVAQVGAARGGLYLWSRVSRRRRGERFLGNPLSVTSLILWPSGSRLLLDYLDEMFTLHPSPPFASFPVAECEKGWGREKILWAVGTKHAERWHCSEWFVFGFWAHLHGTTT